MKILVLNGSPRKGNTLTAINSFAKGVSCEHEVEVVKDLNFFICADNEPKSMPAYDFGSCCDNNKKLTKRVSYCFMLTTNW